VCRPHRSKKDYYFLIMTKNILKLHSEKCHNVYVSLNVTRVIKLRNMRRTCSMYMGGGKIHTKL
jgi:hypothetical protein